MVYGILCRVFFLFSVAFPRTSIISLSLLLWQRIKLIILSLWVQSCALPQQNGFLWEDVKKYYASLYPKVIWLPTSRDGWYLHLAWQQCGVCTMTTCHAGFSLATSRLSALCWHFYLSYCSKCSHTWFELSDDGFSGVTRLLLSALWCK